MTRPQYYYLLLLQLLSGLGWLGSLVHAADEFERPPISYSKATPENPISRLQTKLDAGSAKLKYEPKLGYLPALLAELNIPVESQVLVFSKTSLQVQRITPQTPRAIYFNDDAYVGFVQGGEVLEVSIADPQLGTVFYTVEQSRSKAAHFDRQTDNCLICHGSSRTQGVPGHLLRSLYVDAGGQPILSAGSNTVDPTTPFPQRWGGWYVTGKHGDQKHLGNLIIQGHDVPRDLENKDGQNVVDLKDRFEVGRYLSPHSDLIALLVLDHQTYVHNRLTKANFEARQALAYDVEMKKILGEDGARHLDSTLRRMHSAGDELLEALLSVDELKFTAPVSGTSSFAENFAKSGPRDKRGRSLRDLDLHTRLRKYPCSYLIYSASFDALPGELREYVWRQLWQILNATEPDKQYAHLSAQDRLAIIEILRETKPNLPDYWLVKK